MDHLAAVVAMVMLCACLLQQLVAGARQLQEDNDPIIGYHFRNAVADTEAGRRFAEVFSEARMLQMMSDATAAVWETLEIDHYPDNTNNYTDVYMTLKDLHSFIAGLASENRVSLNSGLLKNRDDEEGQMEGYVQWVVFHEMTHVWQQRAHGWWSEEDRALREGTANYVSKRAGHDVCDIRLLWKYSWRDGYCPTMYFLEYLTELGGDGIVAEINRRLNDHDYREDDFVDLVGSTPDELWKRYLKTLPTLVTAAGGKDELPATRYIL